MKPAPFQLLDYVTEEVVFAVNPAYRLAPEDAEEPEAPSEGGTFFVRPEVLSYPEGEAPGLLRLVVSVDETHEDFPYYQLRIAVTGRFQHIDPNPPVGAAEVGAYYLQERGLHPLRGDPGARPAPLCRFAVSPASAADRDLRRGGRGVAGGRGGPLKTTRVCGPTGLGRAARLEGQPPSIR